MAIHRYHVVERPGETTLPCTVVDGQGRGWRLLAVEPPTGGRWIGTLGGAPVWAERSPGLDGAPPLGELVEVDDAVVEDALDLGPDAGTGEGLFDRTGTEATGTGDITGVVQFGPGGTNRRTAVLAWVAATANEADEAPGPATGPPAEALVRLVLDAPLDPLPAYDPGERESTPPLPHDAPPPRPAPPPERPVEPAPPQPAGSVGWLVAALALLLAVWFAIT